MAISKVLSIRLQNFQSHRGTKVTLSEGVTTLAGESSNGKTAVLRALRWVLTNRPTGIGFVSHWAKKTNAKGEIVLDGTCSVTLEVTDTEGKVHTVERVRSATTNAYILDGETLEAVGTDVPPAVVKLLGLKEVNTQSQDDPYFMLTLPSGQVAAKLNELVHLDDIDKAYGFLHRRKVEANVLLKEDAVDINEQKRIIDNLKHIPQCEEDFKAIEELEEKSDELRTKIDTLRRIRDAVEECSNLLSSLAFDNVADDVSRIRDMIVRRDEMADELKDLKALKGDLSKTVSELEALGPIADIDKEALLKFAHTWEELVERAKELNEMKEWLKAAKIELDECSEELSEAEKELPDTCPLCGQPFGGEHDNCCG